MSDRSELAAEVCGGRTSLSVCNKEVRPHRPAGQTAPLLGADPGSWPSSLPPEQQCQASRDGSRDWSLIYSGTILGSWGQRLVGGFLRLQAWLTIKYFFVLGSKLQGPRQSTFPCQCPSHIHLTSSKPTHGGVQPGLPCAVHLCVTLSTLLSL